MSQHVYVDIEQGDITVIEEVIRLMKNVCLDQFIRIQRVSGDMRVKWLVELLEA